MMRFIVPPAAPKRPQEVVTVGRGGGGGLKLGVFPGPYLVQFWCGYVRASGVAQFLVSAEGVVSRGECGESPEEARCVVQWDGVEVGFSYLEGVEVHGRKPPRPVLCFGVYGLAKKLDEGEYGWLTVGQGEVYQRGQCEVYNSFYDLELGNKTPQVYGTLEIEGMTFETYVPPRRTPSYPGGGAGGGGEGGWGPFVEFEKRLWEALPFATPFFRRVHNPTIACHGGMIPRDLYYRCLNRVRASDAWLFAQLDVMFRVRGIDTYVKGELPDIGEWGERACAIVSGVCNPVTRFDYQYDTLRDGREYEHFSPTALQFQAGDCEDFGWINSNLLCALQRRDLRGDGTVKDEGDMRFLNQCTCIMRFYVVVNCLCQARAPALTMKGGRPSGKHQHLTSLFEERRGDGEFPAYHMTCILYPLADFFEFIQRSTPKFDTKKAISNILPPKYVAYLEKNREKMGNHLYAEGTAPIFPIPDQNFTLVDFEKQQKCQIPGVDPAMLPCGENCPSAVYPYGALLQVLTDYFMINPCENCPRAITFIPSDHTDDIEIAAPLELHMIVDKKNIRFTPVQVVDDKQLASSFALWHLEPPMPSLYIDINEYKKRREAFFKLTETKLRKMNSEERVFFGFFTKRETEYEWPSLYGQYIYFPSL